LSTNHHLQNISRAFNDPLQISEVVRVICNAKNGKAVNGEIDPLLNQVFKNDVSIDLLFKLFSACFENGIQPKIFGKGTINPIPKSGNNDRRIPQ